MEVSDTIIKLTELRLWNACVRKSHSNSIWVVDIIIDDMKETTSVE